MGDIAPVRGLQLDVGREKGLILAVLWAEIKKLPVAAIAGAVGGVVALLGLGIGGFFLYNKKEAPSAAAGASGGARAAGAAGAGGSVSGGKQPFTPIPIPSYPVHAYPGAATIPLITLGAIPVTATAAVPGAKPSSPHKPPLEPFYANPATPPPAYSPDEQLEPIPLASPAVAGGAVVAPEIAAGGTSVRSFATATQNFAPREEDELRFAIGGESALPELSAVAHRISPALPERLYVEKAFDDGWALSKPATGKKASFLYVVFRSGMKLRRRPFSKFRDEIRCAQRFDFMPVGGYFM